LILSSWLYFSVNFNTAQLLKGQQGGLYALH